MSEYQRYEFMTSDRSLTRDQQEAVNALSSHIEASSTHALIEYQWGNFKHDPIKVLHTFFDGFLYWANWGSPELALRFPHGILPAELIDGYDLDEFVTFTHHPDYDILDIHFGEMIAPDEWVDYELRSLISIRDELMDGDLRALYIVWLVSQRMTGIDDEEEDDEMEKTSMAKIHRGANGKDQPGLMGRLSEKSREELLALLEQLMQRQPEIEPLLELLAGLPLATTTQQKKRPGMGREQTIDPSTIRSQVDSAFYHAGEGWDAASRVAVDLEHLSDIGKDFVEAGEWANAQTVYAALAEETMIHYEGLHDEGQVCWVLSECAAGLVACLNAQSVLPQHERLGPSAREELFTALFDLWKFGSNYGGIGENVAEALVEHATAQERKSIEARIREELRPGQDFSSKWHNRHYIDFLATLKQAEHFSDEDVLEEYRKAGLYKEKGNRIYATKFLSRPLQEPERLYFFAAYPSSRKSPQQGSENSAHSRLASAEFAC